MSRGRSPTSNSGTFLALILLLAISAGMLMLTAMVLPQALGLLIVGVGFAMVAAFHYLVWGRWLSSRLAAQDAEVILV